MHIYLNSSQNVPDTLTRHVQHTISTLPLFNQLKTNDFLDDIEHKLKHFKSFETVVIFGTGGSSLGGQTLHALKTSPLNLIFIDNIDPQTFENKCQTLNPKTTGYIAISKSGNTAETLLQTLLCLQHLKSENIDSKHHMLIVTEPKNNAISEIAAKNNIPTLQHPDDIGGRFSIFTVVGAIPAILCGVDFKQLRASALEYIKNPAPALESAVHQYHLNQMGVNQSVMMVYADGLVPFSSWYCQLWGESVGKKDQSGTPRGTTPLRALGAVDQHSQLQLYLDGPKDKLITVITLKNQVSTNTVNHDYDHPALSSLHGKTMGDLMVAEQRATIETLKTKGCHVRHMEIDQFNAVSLGRLLAHFMVETIAMAELLDVTPFDQPAVEDGKVLALQYLKAS